MKVLNSAQVKQKLKRLAYEIVENNFAEKQLVFAGINTNGLNFAKLLIKEIKAIRPIELILTSINLNPAKPLDHPITIDLLPKELQNKVVIVTDDVANTGRTIFYATRPFMDCLPKKIQVAVLVDRKHKSFPIKADYVGLSLATTLKENIAVKLKPIKEMNVALH